MELDKRCKQLNPTLSDLHNMYQKWIHVKDLNRLDIVLAIRLIAKTSGTRVWLILIGSSGDWKSEQLRALSNHPDVKVLRCFTSKTLITGFAGAKDLAPDLRNKCVIIQDFAQILKLFPTEKAEVWAQLRDLYDGFAGKQTGSGKSADYKDLNVTLIGASTPAIDNQILIHQDLGTRELLWRCKSEDDNILMDKIIDNESYEDMMRTELEMVTNNFVNSHKYDYNVKIPNKILSIIKKLAYRLCYFRASADIDSYSGELRGSVYPEKPTRVLKQFKRIYIALKSLDPDYSDDRAVEILEHLVNSCSVENRLNIYNFMKLVKDEMSSSRIADGVRLGKRTAIKELNILWNLGIVRRRTEETQWGQEHWFWSLDLAVVEKLFGKAFAGMPEVKEEMVM